MWPSKTRRYSRVTLCATETSCFHTPALFPPSGARSRFRGSIRILGPAVCAIDLLEFRICFGFRISCFGFSPWWDCASLAQILQSSGLRLGVSQVPPQSSCRPVILSSCHPVVLSSCHPVHPVILSIVSSCLNPSLRPMPPGWCCPRSLAPDCLSEPGGRFACGRVKLGDTAE
jgi:hypothetical protein